MISKACLNVRAVIGAHAHLEGILTRERRSSVVVGTVSIKQPLLSTRGELTSFTKALFCVLREGLRCYEFIIPTFNKQVGLGTYLFIM